MSNKLADLHWLDADLVNEEELRKLHIMTSASYDGDQDPVTAIDRILFNLNESIVLVKRAAGSVAVEDSEGQRKFSEIIEKLVNARGYFRKLGDSKTS